MLTSAYKFHESGSICEAVLLCKFNVSENSQSLHKLDQKITAHAAVIVWRRLSHFLTFWWFQGTEEQNVMSYWKSHITLNMMTEDFTFNNAAVPSDLRRYMKMWVSLHNHSMYCRWIIGAKCKLEKLVLNPWIFDYLIG